MRNRCNNPNVPKYRDYGARGIKVCDRWNHSYANFEKDMLPSYKKGLTLDRINNDKGYSRKNCKWTTMMEQQNNKRSNKLVELNGITKTFTQWVRILNLKKSTISMRYYVLHWPIERCFQERTH